MTYTQQITDQYTQPELSTYILKALEQHGKDVSKLTREDIAAVEEFHIRGREATREIANLAGLHAGMEVLDLGSGLGGAARTLAAEYGCKVTGIDLVEEYCNTAEKLSQLTGLTDYVTFRQGNIMDIPFEDSAFDVAWAQHSQMNIPDKRKVYHGVQRVLKSGGRFVLYEICAGSGGPPHFPVPWANDASISFLLSPEEMRQLLLETGFKEVIWRDVSQISLEWYQRISGTINSLPANIAPPVGLNLLMGTGTAQKLNNLGRNLAESRIRVVQGIFAIE